MVHILAIDPGLDGGLVFLSETGQIVGAYRMPTQTDTMASGKNRRRVDEDALSEIVRSHREGLIEAWIENVRSRPTDGHVGAFSFGEGKGVLKGVLGALGVERRYADPAGWKAAMGLTKDKKLSIRKAQGMFPKHAHVLGYDGVAEASLLAVYGLLRRVKAPQRTGA